MIGDLLTALIGVVAIGLTTYTIGQTREQRRLDAFTRMHDLLTTEESQRGRRMLYAAADGGSWPERDSPEWDEMNRALSMLETLAMSSTRRLSIASWPWIRGAMGFAASGGPLSNSSTSAGMTTWSGRI
jgi:hypothetical protein